MDVFRDRSSHSPDEGRTPEPKTASTWLQASHMCSWCARKVYPSHNTEAVTGTAAASRTGAGFLLVDLCDLAPPTLEYGMRGEPNGTDFRYRVDFNVHEDPCQHLRQGTSSSPQQLGEWRGPGGCYCTPEFGGQCVNIGVANIGETVMEWVRDAGFGPEGALRIKLRGDTCLDDPSRHFVTYLLVECAVKEHISEIGRGAPTRSLCPALEDDYCSRCLRIGSPKACARKPRQVYTVRANTTYLQGGSQVVGGPPSLMASMHFVFDETADRSGLVDHPIVLPPGVFNIELRTVMSSCLMDPRVLSFAMLSTSGVMLPVVHASPVVAWANESLVLTEDVLRNVNASLGDARGDPAAAASVSSRRGLLVGQRLTVQVRCLEAGTAESALQVVVGQEVDQQVWLAANCRAASHQVVRIGDALNNPVQDAGLGWSVALMSAGGIIAVGVLGIGQCVRKSVARRRRGSPAARGDEEEHDDTHVGVRGEEGSERDAYGDRYGERGPVRGRRRPARRTRERSAGASTTAVSLELTSTPGRLPGEHDGHAAAAASAAAAATVSAAVPV